VCTCSGAPASAAASAGAASAGISPPTPSAAAAPLSAADPPAATCAPVPAEAPAPAPPLTAPPLALAAPQLEHTVCTSEPGWLLKSPMITAGPPAASRCAAASSTRAWAGCTGRETNQVYATVKNVAKKQLAGAASATATSTILSSVFDQLMLHVQVGNDWVVRPRSRTCALPCLAEPQQ
jgi:hypothetical protein